MPTGKENAISLYMEGIQQGNIREAIKKYTGDHYTQHSAGVADGQEGFLAFFEPFMKRCPVRDFKLLRALQEGSKVFVHVFQDINNGDAQWITADFFDTDSEGRIVEHWDTISAVKPNNPSGRSQTDGATEIVDLDKTAANKKLVLDFINTILVNRELSRIGEFIDQTTYIQHNPEVGDGIKPLVAFLTPEDLIQYQECFMSVAEGNFVATLNRATISGKPFCIIDLFRVANGKIVEHWDNSEPIAPKEEWANSGKF